MKKLLVIAIRDIRSAFFSPLAYGLLSIFVCLSGYFFFNLLGSFNFAVAQEAQLPIGELDRSLNLNEWVVQGYFQTELLLLILMTPLITMRAFAEERQNGTYLLLASLPVSAAEIFVGKFLASLFLILSMLVISFCLPLGLCIVADPEVFPILLGMVGLLLAATAFVAFAVSISAATRNAMLSGVLSMGLLLVLYGAHAPAESFGETGQIFLRYLSPLWQLRELFRGVLTLAPLVYFSSITLMALVMGSYCLKLQSRGHS